MNSFSPQDTAENSELLKELMNIGEEAKKKRFSCSFCEYSCKTKKDMKMHERTHTGEKPYSCKYCDAYFATSSALVCHIRVHTGEKPYKCDQCDKAFTVKSALNSHKHTHSERRVKTFQCTFCDKAFYERSILKRHTRIHTGEKPFFCQKCMKAYSDSSCRNSHEKRCKGPKTEKIKERLKGKKLKRKACPDSEVDVEIKDKASKKHRENAQFYRVNESR